MATNNPGKTMATAVDSEIASFQMLQSELQQLRSDQQVLLSQQNENEMVKQVRLPKRNINAVHITT